MHVLREHYSIRHNGALLYILYPMDGAKVANSTSEKLMKAITASAFCFSFLFCFVFILFNHLLSVFPYVTENRNIIFSLSPNLLHPFVFYKSEVELISRSSASQISDGLWTHHSPLQLTRSSGAQSACCSDSASESSPIKELPTSLFIRCFELNRFVPLLISLF